MAGLGLILLLGENSLTDFSSHRGMTWLSTALGSGIYANFPTFPICVSVAENVSLWAVSRRSSDVRKMKSSLEDDMSYEDRGRVSRRVQGQVITAYKDVLVTRPTIEVPISLVTFMTRTT